MTSRFHDRVAYQAVRLPGSYSAGFETISSPDDVLKALIDHSRPLTVTVPTGRFNHG